MKGHDEGDIVMEASCPEEALDLSPGTESILAGEEVGFLHEYYRFLKIQCSQAPL